MFRTTYSHDQIAEFLGDRVLAVHDRSNGDSLVLMHHDGRYGGFVLPCDDRDATCEGKNRLTFKSGLALAYYLVRVTANGVSAKTLPGLLGVLRESDIVSDQKEYLALSSVIHALDVVEAAAV
jgi:hypothetical protein